MEESKAGDDGLNKIEDQSSDSRDEAMEYPTKFKLAMVVVALMLSMFLVN